MTTITTDLQFGEPLDTSPPFDLQFGGGGGGGTSTQQGTLLVLLPFPGVTILADYDTNVRRGPSSSASARWQATTPSARATPAGWSQAATVSAADAVPWGEATPVHRHLSAPIASQIRVSRTTRAPHADATPTPAARTAARWQAMTPIPHSRTLCHADASPVSRSAAAPWQARAPRFASLSTAWQEAARITREVIARHRSGTPVARASDIPWQDARRPPPGRRIPAPPPEPPQPEACYTPPPASAVHLILAAPWMPSTALIFRCRDFDLPASTVIPYRRVYMSVHTLAAVLLPTLEPVALQSLTFSTDADSYCWTLNATGGPELMEQLAPTAGAPAQIRITLDGMSWVFAVDDITRRRAFGQHQVQVTGYSVTKLLGAPHYPETTRTNATDLSAAALVNRALDLTGIDADWQITDWLVPTGAWSHTGTPLDAVRRIAETVRAVVQSDRLTPTLRITPRYPVLPWDWNSAGVAADVQLPLASIITDSWQRRDAPAYNRAIVTGQNQGVLGLVTRSGTAGDILAPMVTDALITAQAAVLQRAESILGAAGPQAQQIISLPVLTGGTQPGVLSVGQLAEVVEPAETWRGLVRAVQVSVDFPRVRQQVTIERHL